DALGGEVIAVEETSDTEDIWSVSTEDDGTAGLGKGEQEDPLLKQIEAAESRHELLMIYTANKAEWERPEIAAAAKAKAAEWPKRSSSCAGPRGRRRRGGPRHGPRR